LKTAQRWSTASAVSYKDALGSREVNLTATKSQLRVATENNSGPCATVGVWVEAGSRYETPKNNGVSHMIEHLAFKGTGSRSESQLMTEAENLGIKLNTYSTREMIAVYATCQSQDVSKAVEILADIVKENSYSNDAVKMEKVAVQAELDAVETNTKTVCMDYLYASAFQGTPLGKSIFGTTESIQSLTAKDLNIFKSTHFKPARMVLAAAGGIDHSEMVSLGEKYFSDMSASYDYEIPTLTKCRFTGSEIRARYDDLPLAHVAIAVEGAPFGTEDSLALSVATMLIGSWEPSYNAGASMSSRLASANAQFPMSHNFHAFYNPYSDTGMWGLYFSADRMTIEDMMFNVQGEWMRLCSSVTESEVARAKNQLKMKLLEKMESTQLACDVMAKEILYTGKQMSLSQLDAAIDTISAKTVRDVCMKYLYDKCPAVSGVGPVEALPDYNRVRGAMYWLRL
jgi:processing peptidase subunit beta